jgi:hypothetical protein
MADQPSSDAPIAETVTVPPSEVVQVKFFALDSTDCECGKTIEVVRVAVTRESRPFLQAYCSDCAIEEATLLHQNGYHSERGSGMALFNGDFVPEPVESP